MTVIKGSHLGCQPTGDMDAVRNVTDRHFLFAAPRPKAGPHAATDNSVQIGNSIGAAAALEGQHGHAEGFAGIIRVDSSQADQSTRADSQLICDRSQVLFKQVPLESVMPCGHGSMSCEAAMPYDLSHR